VIPVRFVDEDRNSIPLLELFALEPHLNFERLVIDALPGRSQNALRIDGLVPLVVDSCGAWSRWHFTTGRRSGLGCESESGQCACGVFEERPAAPPVVLLVVFWHAKAIIRHILVYLLIVGN
jgi:hypothetical protein